MNRYIPLYLVAILVGFTECREKGNRTSGQPTLFPDELVHFIPAGQYPIFTGTGTDTWDRNIRERGYILKENGLYKMWYSGYDGGGDAVKHLGYATSGDGIHWMRYPGNPIYDKNWTEDVFVVHHEGQYYLVAEGENDIAHMLTSKDGIQWTSLGNLDIRKVNGEAIDPGPYGTPTLWIENGNWYLFYERNDVAIWLAVSTDHKVWTNVQDDPVIEKGPDRYDSEGVAVDQVIKYHGRYYAYYHGSPDKDWATWNSNVATSNDLIHWIKYENNPIVRSDSINKDISSPILVYDGDKYRLYTMHDGVRVYFPANEK